MDLIAVFGALRKRKWIMFLSLLLGIWLAFNVLYVLTFDSMTRSIKLRPRSSTMYETKIRLLLDSPDFGLGNLGLSDQSGMVLGRTVAISKTYALLIKSDQVMARLIKKFGPLPSMVVAQSLEGVPVIEITVQGTDSQTNKKFARAVAKNFIDYVSEQQKSSSISPRTRVTITSLDSASPATVPIKSRQAEYAFIAFITPFVMGALIAFFLESHKRLTSVVPVKGNKKLAKAQAKVHDLKEEDLV